jgi:hypothetical protein
LGKPSIQQIEDERPQIISQNQQDGKDDNGDEEKNEREFDDSLAAVGGKL